ncbi:MAG: class I SAM-dependent methyltransferase [Gemmatimonadales bacterium]
MNVAYWDDLADQWDDKVFSARRYDRHRVVPQTLQRIARRRRGQVVADFGCGPGDFIPLLSRTFERVVAYDQSPKCVELAARRSRRLRNVEVVRPPSTLDDWHDQCDVVLCVNVVIHPRRQNRMQTLERALDLLRPGGRLVLVVPSIESECLLAEATRTAARNTVRMPRGKRSVNIGVLSVVGVPTKHFAAAELRALAAGLGLREVEVSRVEYSWSSYGLRPIRPAGLRPWDWMVEARC